MAYTGDAEAPGRIRLKVAEMAKKRGLVIRQKGPNDGKVNMTKLSHMVNCPASTLFPILRYPAQQTGITFNLLSRLCQALNCQPGDLMEYVADETQVQYHVPDVSFYPSVDEALEG